MLSLLTVSPDMLRLVGDSLREDFDNSILRREAELALRCSVELERD